ncbi:MAG: homocysteine S-methyltransferase family protein [Pseudomonadota bacterium]
MTITILDGGMGQELLARTGAEPTGLWATQVMMDHPEAVRAIHADYFAAGADIATINSYAIHRDRLDPAGQGDRFEELHRQAVTLAAEARDAHGSGRIAGALGPLGWSYKAELAPPSDVAARLYADIVAIQDPYVDLFVLETMSGVDQARGGLMGTAHTEKPVCLGLSVDDNDGTKLRSGEPLEDILPLLTEYRVDAVLLNCSRPEAISQGLPVLARAGLPFGGYANGFTSIAESFKAAGETVKRLESRRDLGPAEYANFTDHWISLGATIVGGCCEVGPAHIAEIATRVGKRIHEPAH